MPTMKADTLPNTVAVLCLLLAGAPAAQAQGDFFSYDASGNLAIRAAAATAPPLILRQPAPQVVEPGHAATFSVTLADPRGATFQWKFNGTNLTGANGDSLRVANVAAANEGPYTVTITNGSGSVTSTAAMLWFDSDGDGLPDTWEIANFGNLAQNALGDFDGDGVSNLDEFLQGTNPTDSASFRVRLRVATVGNGSVAVSPLREFYTAGDTVALTAVPAAPYGFDHWSGDLTTTTSSTTLTLTANKSVTAVFSYAPVPPGLIAWWRAETDASDLIAGHHGAFYSGASPVGPAVTPAGLVGGAFNFDGTTHVRVPDAADLRPERFSVEMWVYPTVQTTSRQTLFARGSSTDDHKSWSITLIDGKVRFSYENLFNTEANVMDGNYNFPLNQWTHVAASFDGSTLRLYTNGLLANSTGGFGTTFYDPAAVPVTIGSAWIAGASANRFTGRIDEVSFYDRALGDAEVAAIAAIGRIGKSLLQPYLTTPARLPDGVVSDAYAIPFAAVIGPAPFVFDLAAGTLPPGLALAQDGTLSGAPTQPGDYAFTVAVRDAAGRLRQQAYSLQVSQRIAPPLGMLGWWRAEPDPSGLARDQVAGRDGTFYRNGVAVPGTDVAGKVGRAFTFDGALHIRVPDAAGLRPAQVTGEAWVYPIVRGGYQTALAKGSSTGSEDTWWLGMLNGYPQFYSSHQNNAFNALTGPTLLPLNQWTHLAFTFDGAITVLYVNGVAVNNQVGLGPLVYSPSVPLTIGADWSAGAPSDACYGRVDEVTLYGRALSAREIAGIAAAGAGGKALTGPFSVDLGRAVAGRAFTGSFSFPMGAAPVTYSLVSGTLPPGFVLGANGTLSGTSATRGDFTFTVRATDSNGAWQDQTAALRVYLAANRPPGLISWYRAENNALDAIGTNHGTLVGAAGYAAGKVGAAFTLNGSTDYVQIPDAPSLRTDSITVETWVSAQQLGNVNVLLGKTVGTGTADTWTLYYQGGFLHAAITTTSGVGDVASPWSPQQNRWYHLALVYDSTAQLRLYIDGARVASGAKTTPLLYDNHPVIFGMDLENESPNFFFKGKIDEVAIYGRALSDAEIAAIYAADLAGKALPGLGDNEDPDGDGLANVLEYALGTDPARFSLAPAVSILRNPDGSTQGRISFLRDPAKTDLTLTVESSGDLMDWVPIATSVNGLPFTGIATVTGEVAGSAPRVITVIDPFAETPVGFGQSFLRVRAVR